MYQLFANVVGARHRTISFVPIFSSFMSNTASKITTEISQDSVVKVEKWFLWIAIVLPLLNRVIYVLTGKLILQLNCNYRNTVQRQNHIDGVLDVFAIYELTSTFKNILVVLLDKFGI